MAQLNATLTSLRPQTNLSLKAIVTNFVATLDDVNQTMDRPPAE